MEAPEDDPRDASECPDPIEFAWSCLREMSGRERELSRELDEVRDELYEHARAMKESGTASVDKIAKALGRNRQRVNAWMRAKPKRPDRAGQDSDAGWVDPEGHVQF